MIPPQTTFLGKTHTTQSVKGGTIELTGYNHDSAFEEWHAHENASLSFLLSGGHQEDLLGKKYSRIPGDIKFIPAGELHRCNNYMPATQKINFDLPYTLLKQLEISQEGILNLLHQTRQPKFTLLKLYRDLNDTGSYSTASSHLLLYELFHPDLNRLKNKGHQPPAWVLTLKQLLHDEWNTVFDLNDLSVRLGIHPVTISRYFPHYFSSTLSNYIKLIRVDKSLGLIKGSRLPLTEIAYICGFADQAHFTRTFKAVTGFLPKEFRKI
jgi:AraC family transcriptional regulator